MGLVRWWRNRAKRREKKRAAQQQLVRALEFYRQRSRMSQDGLQREISLWKEQGAQSCLAFGQDDANSQDLGYEILAQLEFIEKSLDRFRTQIFDLTPRQMLDARRTLNRMLTHLERP